MYKKKRKLWMMVTNDVLQFPIHVADSAEELAEMINEEKKRAGKKPIKARSIRNAVAKAKCLGTFSQYVCVELDEEDE